jgi:large subunit ribosomal protein L4
LARKSALTYKAKDNSIAILEDFNFEAPKTKQYLAMLKSLSLGDKKTLFILPEVNKNVVLSSRNVRNTKVITAAQLNTYDVMNADNLVFAESSINSINSLLK